MPHGWARRLSWGMGLAVVVALVGCASGAGARRDGGGSSGSEDGAMSTEPTQLQSTAALLRQLRNRNDRDEVASQVVDQIDAETMAALLRDWGLSSKVERIRGNDVVLARLDVLRVQVFLFDCSGRRCQDVQFHVAFALTEPLGQDFVNRWNTKYRYGRLYLDDEGDPHLEVDATLTGGVTVRNLSVYFALFMQLTQRLMVELARNGHTLRA